MVMPFGGRVGDGFLPPSSRGQALSGNNGGEGAYERRPYGDAGGRGFATAARFLGSASLRSE